MSKAILELLDEVNCRFIDLPVDLRRSLTKKYKMEIPGSRFTPAVRLGRWDGCYQFFNLSGTTFINLLPEILEDLVNVGVEIDMIDHRVAREPFEFEPVTETSYQHAKWPKNHPLEGQPIIMRDYQASEINDFLADPQSIRIIATGGGKSVISGVLAHKVEKYGRSILIVPSKSLVEQTEQDYKNLGLDVGVFYGERKEYGHTHSICTWQSLGALSKKTKKKAKGEITTDFIDMEAFLKDVVCVMIDEAHQSKADVLRDLLAGPFAHIPIRWGFTGTLPEGEFAQKCLTVSIGQVTGQLSAKELQDSGVLSSCKVHIKQMIDYKEFKKYPDELKYLVETQERIKYIADEVTKISQSGNTLVLVGRTATGRQLAKLIPNSIFISGTTKQSARKSEFDDIATATNRVIIATSGIAAVGINLPRIFHLVFIEAGKSFVRVIQSVGRGLRKAQDKDHVDIWDYCSTCKFSKTHLTKRKKMYKAAGYPFAIEKVEWQQ